MPTCPECGTHFRVPPDECADHPCPRCGFYPYEKEGSEEMPFDADPITPHNWDPMLRVRKKPIVVHATQLNFEEGFEVTTMEGRLRGKPGDYLLIGVKGEKYPVDREIFEATYDLLEDEEIDEVVVHFEEDRS